MLTRNRPLLWAFLAVALTFPVLAARAVWEADWLYLVVLALLAGAMFFRVKWEWQGRGRQFAYSGMALATVVVVAFVVERLGG
jgi:hypothetical protein